MTDRSVDIIGIGSPLVDVVVQVSDAFIAETVGGAKGGMEMVDASSIEQWVHAAGVEPALAAGGAASNTTVGAAALGLNTAFIGSAGDDELAGFYRKALALVGCEARLQVHPAEPTGRVLSLVTPDAERTMRTCLGAAAAMDPAAVTKEWFADARLVMLEGYTLFNHDLTLAIAKAVKAAGCELALDLASFEVVQANRAVLDELLSGLVDIVFANEDEAAAWHADGMTAAYEDLAKRCKVAVVKQGADGAWIARGEERVKVGAEKVEQVLDTTGAGDNWAAGFLAGYVHGLPLEVCGKLAAKAGAAAVSVVGAQVPVHAWQEIRGYLHAQVD